ncbi:PP2C family protein-serine/threonine phosphatase [Streptomyces sp. NPDC058603]|uniref:PP2C family protein-serine/threonine phosphatase n=1 Tax=unclassified Streptomyces TaxID=2593676 RepID=UPI003649B48B
MDRLTARWSYARWAPHIIMVIAVVVDVTTPADYTGVPLISAACVLAGAMMSFRGAAWAGVFALGITVLLEWRTEVLLSPMGWSAITNVVLATLIGLDMNRMVYRHNKRLASVRSMAETMQRAVLPNPPTHIGPLQVAAHYEAADAEARIGGDAFAIQDTPYGVRILIGDVRGKGTGAVSTTSTLIGAFREAAHYVSDIGELAIRLEQSLERESAEHQDDEHHEEFATALIAQIDHQGQTLLVINRGHPEPYLIRTGSVTALTATTPDVPLGIGALTRQRSGPDLFPLAPRDILLFVTDGVTEARAPDGAFYAPETELRLPRTRDITPAALLDELADAIHHWTGGPRDDDMATLALKIP